jgi:hypothetical protein
MRLVRLDRRSAQDHLDLKTQSGLGCKKTALNSSFAARIGDSWRSQAKPLRVDIPKIAAGVRNSLRTYGFLRLLSASP